MVVNFKYLIGTLALMLWANIAHACDVSMDNAWVRLPPPTSDVAAAYMRLSNDCKQSKVLQSISSPQAAMTMMHDAHMQAMPSLVIDAGQSVSFRPQHAHIMLMGLKDSLHQGESIILVLHWQDGSNQSTRLLVKDMRK